MARALPLRLSTLSASSYATVFLSVLLFVTVLGAEPPSPANWRRYFRRIVNVTAANDDHVIIFDVLQTATLGHGRTHNSNTTSGGGSVPRVRTTASVTDCDVASDDDRHVTTGAVREIGRVPGDFLNAIKPPTTRATTALVIARYEMHVLKSKNNQATGSTIAAGAARSILYFCVAPAETWYHQGRNIWISASTTTTTTDSHKNYMQKRRIRHRRSVSDDASESARQLGTAAVESQPAESLQSPLPLPATVHGLRVEISPKEVDFDENSVPQVLANTNHTVRLFGGGFTASTVVVFTAQSLEAGASCQFPTTTAMPVEGVSANGDTARVHVSLPPMGADTTGYYVCVQSPDGTRFVHQGVAPWLQIRTYEHLLPLWLSITVVVVCLMFSALFSGLNLGLMSLDRTELKILCNTGTVSERRHAKVIQPVRNHGNYLLCSILLGNVFVNSIFTIFLDSLTSGLIAVLCSTISIVLFGEITPQAICSRHGLAVGAKTIYITKFVMFITFPLSYPVSKLLDCLLGEEIGNVYTRERLKELVQVTTGENDLDRDEVNIISGALELRRKTVSEVMTKIDDIFMLDYETVLDFATVNEIMKSGYSRVPVYEHGRENIVTMLYIKDLAFVDPDDNTPLRTLCQFYQNPCNFVFEDVTLDVMFKIFKEGNKGHMAFIQRINTEGDGDPFYETVGLITLEDVIEELIQAEIMDETDVFTDNRTKRRRNAQRLRQDFSVFAERRDGGQRIHISPQLTLAAFQFLSTSVDYFVPKVMSETILKRLLKQDIVYHIRKNKEWRTAPQNIIYQQSKSADYFVLILEGRVEVTVGKENLLYEGGPFSYFGVQAFSHTAAAATATAPPPPQPPTPESAASAAPTTSGTTEQAQPLQQSVQSQPQSQQQLLLGSSLDSLNLDALVRYSFLPDYTVRACTEVIYLCIKRALYFAAKRATLLERSQREGTAQNTEQFDAEVHKILHRLRDDDSEGGPSGTQQQPSSPAPKRSSGIDLLKPSGSSSGSPLSLQQQQQRTQPQPPPSSTTYSSASPPHRLSAGSNSFAGGTPSTKSRNGTTMPLNSSGSSNSSASGGSSHMKRSPIEDAPLMKDEESSLLKT